MIFGAKIKKKQSTSKFDAAWTLTASYEGAWDAKGDDDGHYFPQSASNEDWYSIIPAPDRTKIGTSWGITGQVLILCEKCDLPMKKTILFLDKKRLRHLLSVNSVPVTPYLFRKLFFTDAFIQKGLELSLLDFNAIRIFNREQTQLIIDHFQLNEDDLK
jgi:hypothetical protein